MTSNIKTQTPSQAAHPTAFPVPFTRDEFQEDVAEVFLYYVRTIAWMTDHDTAWAILNLPPDEASFPLFDPDLGASDINLTYGHIRHTEFAKALMQMYEYAYYGHKDNNEEQIANESIHTWITCLVCDARDGEMDRAWGEYGWTVRPNAERCSQVAETANARLTLEGADPFFFTFQHSGKEGYLSSDVLTVRQLSLLSGMEEMSIRAAANPKRQSPLKTITTDHGTRIEIDVAKDWLISKGRYVPIANVWSAAEINLTKVRFETYAALDSALQSRYRSFCNERGRDGLDTELSQANINTGKGLDGPLLDLSPEDYQHEDKMRVLARVLELPADLLILRVQETAAQENLRQIERALREAMQNLE
jgi:hypothetical protein